MHCQCLILVALLLLGTSAVAPSASPANASFCQVVSAIDGCSELGCGSCTPHTLPLKARSDKFKGVASAQQSKTSSSSDAVADKQQVSGLQDSSQVTAASSQSVTDSNHASQNFSCKVNEREEIDWFIAIKRPGSHEHAYISTNNKNNWIHAGDITSKGPVFETLNQALRSPDFADAYSDKPPNETHKRKYGHLKGLFMFGQSSGFWMMYSARNYPKFENGGLHQDATHAQSFICISASNTELTNLAQSLSLAKPRYYRGDVPAANSNRNISVHQLKSKSDKLFKVFIKPKNSPRECIYQRIRQEYNNGFRVQSWLRTNPTERSADENDVTNIESIRMNVKRSTDQSRPDLWQWNTNNDHSKWCVSNNINQAPMIVCLSDLNRNKEHLKQGGAAVCLSIPDVWRAFNALPPLN